MAKQTLFLVTRDLLAHLAHSNFSRASGHLGRVKFFLELVKVGVTRFRVPAVGRLSNAAIQGRLADAIVKHLVSGLIGTNEESEVEFDRICFKSSLKHIQEHRVQHQQCQGSCSLWSLPLSPDEGTGGHAYLPSQGESVENSYLQNIEDPVITSDRKGKKFILHYSSMQEALSDSTWQLFQD